MRFISFGGKQRIAGVRSIHKSLLRLKSRRRKKPKEEKPRTGLVCNNADKSVRKFQQTKKTLSSLRERWAANRKLGRPNETAPASLVQRLFCSGSLQQRGLCIQLQWMQPPVGELRDRKVCSRISRFFWRTANNFFASSTPLRHSARGSGSQPKEGSDSVRYQ